MINGARVIVYRKDAELSESLTIPGNRSGFSVTDAHAGRKRVSTLTPGSYT